MYRKLNIDGFGEVDFYGSAGVMAELESELEISLSELSKDGKISIKVMYALLFWAHYVACKRLRKPAVMDREDIKYHISGENLMSIIPLLIEDISKDFSISAEQKKRK